MILKNQNIKPWIILGGGFLSTILIDHAKNNNIDHILIDRISCDFSSPNCIKHLKSKVPAGSPLMLLASVTRLRGNSFDEFNENIKIVHNILDFNKFNRGHLIYYRFDTTRLLLLIQNSIRIYDSGFNS